MERKALPDTLSITIDEKLNSEETIAFLCELAENTGARISYDINMQGELRPEHYACALVATATLYEGRDTQAQLRFLERSTGTMVLLRDYTGTWEGLAAKTREAVMAYARKPKLEEA